MAKRIKLRPGDFHVRVYAIVWPIAGLPRSHVGIVISQRALNGLSDDDIAIDVRSVLGRVYHVKPLRFNVRIIGTGRHFIVGA